MSFKNFSSNESDMFNKKLDSSVVPCDPQEVIEGCEKYMVRWEYSRECDYQELINSEYEDYIERRNKDRKKVFFKLLRWCSILFKVSSKKDLDDLTKEEYVEIHGNKIKKKVILYGCSWYERAKDIILMAKNCKKDEPIYLNAQDCKIVFKFGKVNE